MTVIAIDQNICTCCQECTSICPNLAIEGLPHHAQKINEDKGVMCGQSGQKCKSYVSAAEHGLGAYAAAREARGLPPSVTEPLFAAHNISHVMEVKKALADPGLYTMVQSAPAVRAAIADDFGAPFGELGAGRLAAALRRLGFDKIFDTNYAADVTIMEGGAS